MRLTKEELKERNRLYYLNNKEKINERARQWKAKNKEKANESSRKSNKKRRDSNPKEIEKNRMLKYKYGISWDNFVELFEKQHGCCAICKTSLSLISTGLKHNTANVDHCHQTNKVRGLLCNPCNQALGLFKDSTTILKNAEEYLNAFI